MNNHNLKWAFDVVEDSIEQHDALIELFRVDGIQSLVRSALQNAIDASYGGTATVVFSAKTLNEGNCPGFFAIRERIEACRKLYGQHSTVWDDALAALGDRNEVDCLVISDYGTTGMTYKYEKGNPYFSMMMAIGDSSKNSKTAGGCYGFGKGALLNFSKIRTILTASRDLENNDVFMGKALLKEHFINGTHYSSSGSFRGEGAKGPVNYFPKICDRKTPGTDIFIPCPQEMSNDEIAKEVIRNFWFSVINPESYGCKLVVKIDVDGQNAITIDSKTIEGHAKRLFGYDLTKTNPLTLIKMVLHPDEEDAHIFEEKLPGLGPCRLYLKKNNDGERDIVYKMRLQGMTIGTEKKSTMVGYVGIFWSYGEEGNQLLRRCEPPTHDCWSVSKGIITDEEEKKSAEKALREINEFIKRQVDFMTRSWIVKGPKITLFTDIIGLTNDDDYDKQEMKLAGDDYDGLVRHTINVNNSIVCMPPISSKPVIYREDDNSCIKCKLPDIDDDITSNPKKKHRKPNYGGDVTGGMSDMDIPAKAEERQIECRFKAVAFPTSEGVHYSAVIVPVFPRGKGAQKLDILKNGGTARVEVYAQTTEDELIRPHIIGCADGYSFKGNIIEGVPLHKGTEVNLEFDIDSPFRMCLVFVLYAK